MRTDNSCNIQIHVWKILSIPILVFLSTIMSLKCNCDIKECMGGVVFYFRRNPKLILQASSPNFVPLSLKSCRLESKENGMRKETLVTQYYQNEEDYAINAIYAVPIDLHSESILLNIEVGSKSICKIVKGPTLNNNEDSKSTLGEIMPKYVPRSNIFQTSLGWVRQGAGVTVMLKYVSSAEESPCAPSCKYSFHPKSTPNKSNTALNEDQNKYDNLTEMAQQSPSDEEEEEEEEHIRDDDGLIPWNERPWGETGRNWGDFGRAWGERKLPWGQYPFK